MKQRYGLGAGFVVAGLSLVALVLPFGRAMTVSTAEAAPEVPAEVHGDRFFRQAIAYVANGKDVVHNVANFFAELEDVRMS